MFVHIVELSWLHLSNTHRRRERGYAFEKSVVNFFNKYGWFARRLGGSSTGLPDVIASITYESEGYSNGILFSMECKSTTSNQTYVPNDQLIRCHEVAQGFGLYDTYIVLAFHFSRVGPRNSKTKEYTKRKQKNYFVMFHNIENIDNIHNIKCTYDGHLSIVRYDQDIPVTTRYDKYEKIKELEKYYLT